MVAGSLMKGMVAVLLIFTFTLNAQDGGARREDVEGFVVQQRADGSLASTGSEPKQNRGVVSAKFGYSTFPDEAPINHFVAGGGSRFYLTHRCSVGPEVLYMQGPGFDRDLVLNLNCGLDFRPDSRLRPYLIGGVGLLHHRNRIRFVSQSFSGNGLAYSGGVGFKVMLNDRLFKSPEVRVGWNPLLMITSSVGYSF